MTPPPTFPDPTPWREQIYSGGWRAAAASTGVIEPATGAVLANDHATNHF